MKYTFTLLFCAFSLLISAQSEDITTTLYNSYFKYKEASLKKRRIKHADIQPLISSYKTNPKFKVSKVGQSIGGKDLSLISMGTGDINIFLWSQMHGDEPTATQAIFDILTFFNSPDFALEKQDILKTITVHFLPMLNPDGAEVYQRRNLLGVDINRDALRLQSPESQTLKKVRDSLQADFGFNLHDQSTYYNAERTNKPATISYLAPAYNYEKDVNEVRGNAMKIIVFMNDILQKYAPGQVGRYNDDFEPRAFGDNIQKWGTSTILIESGGYLNDIEKQEIRKLNYVSIIAALYTIAKGNYVDIPIANYEKIPENNRNLFDLKIKEVSYMVNDQAYTIDVGINRVEVDYDGHLSFWYSSRILDQGDLSTYYGYETFEAEGYTIQAAKVYPKTMYSITALKQLDFNDLMQKGYGYVRVAKLPVDLINSPFPVHLLGPKYKLQPLALQPGSNPTFFLTKNGKVVYGVINGFLVDINSPIKVPNTMVYR